MVPEPEVAGMGQLVDWAVPRNCEHYPYVRARHPRRVVKHDYTVDIEQRERLVLTVQAIDYSGSDHVRVGPP